MAQFGDDTVLITAQRGLIAYDRATGAVKWRRGLEELISSRFDAGSDRAAAPERSAASRPRRTS